MTQPINLLEYEALARQHLSAMAWGYYRSGAIDEITLQENRKAFERYRLRPRVLVDVSQLDLSTTVLGQSLSIPILIAPMAFQCLAHEQGEIATAKAAEKLGTVMLLSTLSTKSLEEVAKSQAQPLRWFQLYVHKDRGLTEALVKRAERAGYQALCLTVDAPLMGRRETDVRNQFTLPQGMQLANLIDLKLPQTADESGLFAYFQQQIDPGLTWQDVAWLRSLTFLPIVLKGILRADDASIAADHGVQGIIVSNHGGRQLDGAIASIDALGEIVAAVGDRLEILVDGGIRRGTDVLKALALGAKAVLLGRPILWGLAVNGEAGVCHVLELLTDELKLGMALSGCPTLTAIDPSLTVR
jgi:4-hydroxymandelate oxidase